MRDGAGVARWAHNPKVVGSNPTPATRNKNQAEHLKSLKRQGVQLKNKEMNTFVNIVRVESEEERFLNGCSMTKS